MSSSVFIERNTLPYNKVKYENEARIVSDSELDSNLVVVYGKNGISFDEKGIQRLIGKLSDHQIGKKNNFNIRTL